MIISYFHHSGDNEPAHAEVTWEQLAFSLSEVRVTPCTLDNCKRSECQHKNGPAWSCARYREGAKRGLPGVVDVHALIVDLDHVHPDELPELLENVEPYKRIIHSSHSDRPKDRCLRVVFQLSRPVLATEWYRFWEQAIQELGIPADTQVRDPSRLYYLPSRSQGADHSEVDGTGFTYEVADGLIIDVDDILSRAPEETVYEIDTDFEIPEFTGAPSQEALATAAEALAKAWPDKGRNTCQLALCGALARAGWPVDLITDFVEAVCEWAQPGNGDRTKRAKSARASVAKVQAGEMVAGWPTVEEFVDPDAVKVAMDALGMGGPKFDQNFVNALSAHVNASNTNLVTVSRDDIQTTLQAARRRLGRSSNPKKLKDALLIARALDGKPFTEHADEDQDRAFSEAIRAVVKFAPRGATNIMLAEYLTRSRPDVPVDTLCELIETARGDNEDDARAELAPDEFILEFTGPRMSKPVSGAQHNFDVALRRLGVTFHYDAFSRKKIMERKIGDSLYRDVCTDRHYNSLMFEIERLYDFFPPKDKFYDYCADRSYTNEFHPVVDYLDGLQAWDGESRAETWLINYCGAADTPYVRAVSRLVLTAAVRRVRQPGCKFDEMLILESPQGAGKSTAIKALCPNIDWFADNFRLDGETKKMIEQTLGKWIIEAGELRGMSARDQNDLKAYLSSTHDEARMAYAREPQRIPRQFIIIGTTNDTQYLKDHTGDRRYWPVKVGAIDVDGLHAIRDQLWAEASFLDLANPEATYIRLDPALYGDAALEQQSRKVDNAIKITLEDKLGGMTGRIKVTDTWKIVGDDPGPAHAIVMQISGAMHELGWVKERTRIDGQRMYYYMRGTEEERQKQLIVTGNLSFGITIKSVDTDAAGNPVLENSGKSLSTN
jgi:hypothetical protein